MHDHIFFFLGENSDVNLNDCQELARLQYVYVFALDHCVSLKNIFFIYSVKLSIQPFSIF